MITVTHEDREHSLQRHGKKESGNAIPLESLFEHIKVQNDMDVDNGLTDINSANEETPEQDALCEEGVRTATSEVVYPQRALTFLIIFVFVLLVGLLIIGLIGLKWINQTQKCGVPSS